MSDGNKKNDNMKHNVDEVNYDFLKDFEDKSNEKDLSAFESEIFETGLGKRKKYLQEKDDFFETKPEYIKITNEIGEPEWVKESELKKREGYFNFEEDMEDASTHKKRLIRKTFIYVIILGSILTVLFLKFIKNVGYIEVETNIKGALIYVDQFPTGLKTDNTLEDLIVGPHTIFVKLDGYVSNPDSIVVNVIKEDGVKAVFELIKIDKDSLKISK
jgi:hypothetical protein